MNKNNPSVHSQSKASHSRWTTPLLLAALTALAPLSANANVPAPPATPPTAKATARTQADIMQDLNATGQELSRIAPSTASILDPQSRKEIAPKAVPLLQKMLADLQDFSQLNPDAKSQVAQAQN